MKKFKCGYILEDVKWKKNVKKGVFWEYNELGRYGDLLYDYDDNKVLKYEKKKNRYLKILIRLECE